MERLIIELTNGLKKISPIPIVSEESYVEYAKRKSWNLFWLIDPLDGTKDFIDRNDEFAINIALIKNNKPILGVVYIPVTDDVYFAQEGLGAFNLGKVFNDTLNFVNGLSFLSLIVGLVTILAGVIGIGNILLISVNERTKEIGIRRALGATPRQVRNQILIESIFLTLIAGIIGIILATIVLFSINYGTKDLTDFPYTNPTVPLKFIFGAFFLMITLGCLIGMIPAQKAVKIRPIEALREE